MVMNAMVEPAKNDKQKTQVQGFIYVVSKDHIEAIR